MSYFKNTTYIDDGTGLSVAPKLDDVTSAFCTVEYEHHEIHSGSMFTTDYTVELGNGASIDIQLTTPNTTKYAHLIYTALTELETELKFYEAPTTSGGTPLTVYNRNRSSSKANTTTVVHTPSVSGVGTLLRTKHFGAGKTVGADSRGMHEWVLAANTKYMLRLTNATTSVNYVSIILNWYEHTYDG